MDFVLQANESSTLLRTLSDQRVADNSYQIPPGQNIMAKNWYQFQPTISFSNGNLVNQQVIFNIPRASLLRNMYLQTIFTTTAALGIDVNYGSTASGGTNYYAAGAAIAPGDLFVPIGLTLFNKIEIKSNSKLIYTFSDAYIQARTHQCPPALCSEIYRNAYPLDTVTFNSPGTVTPSSSGGTANQYTCFTPIFCSFFEDIKNNIDLSFYEVLQVVLTVNNQTAQGLYNGIASFQNMYLWVNRHQPSNRALELLRSVNQQISTPLNMLTYSSFTERINCVNQVTPNLIRLSVNNPVFNQYLSVTPINGYGAAGSSGFCSSLYFDAMWVQIQSFSFSISGQVLLQGYISANSAPGNVPLVLGKYESTVEGDSGGVVSYPTVTNPYGSTVMTSTNWPATAFPGQYPISSVSKLTNRPIAIKWGLGEKMDRTTNMGALSLSIANSPTYTVNTEAMQVYNATGTIGFPVGSPFYNNGTAGTTLAANFQINVVSEFYQIVSLDNTNGTVTVSLAM